MGRATLPSRTPRAIGRRGGREASELVRERKEGAEGREGAREGRDGGSEGETEIEGRVMER